MKVKYSNLYAIEYDEENREKDYGYKYIIPNLYMAYKTDKGFEKFKKIYNLKIKRIEENKSNSRYKSIIFFEPITIEEPLTFWKKEDIKSGMKHFIGLSNGSYVDCYYKHYKDYTLVMRPNPNAKKVYKPYDYLTMCKEWG